MNETIKVGDKVYLISQSDRYPGIVRSIGYAQPLPGEPPSGRFATVEWNQGFRFPFYSSHTVDRLKKINRPPRTVPRPPPPEK